jgi:UDP-N-acetyl-D-galactosamine dehydrogenase
MIKVNTNFINNNKIKVCVIGLGYVGLPVFIKLKEKFEIIGYDIDKKRIQELRRGIDRNLEFSKNNLKVNKHSNYTNKIKSAKKCNFFILTVPTPIFKNNKPDLSHIINATVKISSIIKKNDILIVESTIYPGVTEEICASIIKKKKNYKLNEDFFIGYSSERINPGDSTHAVGKIPKVLSFNTNKIITEKILKVYKVLSSKIILSKSIKAAEISKLLENTQRDINIAFINEAKIICSALNINFQEVIRLARTKWNFLKFNTGLVGGHCLPVDPYYLSYIAKKAKINSRVTLAGRKTNDYMVNFYYKKILEKFIDHKKKLLLIGLTYKENVPDFRNSLSLKLFIKLNKKNKNIYAYDPYIKNLNYKNSNILRSINKKNTFDYAVVLINHSLNEKIYRKLNNSKIISLNSI